jgi:pimeloyl-ACP methyl ester carboxylesterase
VSLVAWVALASLAALPLAAEARRMPLTRALQSRAPGRIADLPKGRTHYQWHGPEDGPVAVCIHGLSSPSYIYAGTARALAALGYRTLTYDLYGRGFSDRPRGRQTVDFFLRQLRDLLADQNVSGPLTVVGYSMGGALATAFAAEEGKNIRALVLMAPAGLEPVYQDLRGKLWTAPLIGDWLMPVAGGWALRRELAMDIDQTTIIPDLYDRLAAETGTRGYLPALLSSRRHVLARTLEEDHRAIAGYETPLLAIWGREDMIIPLTAMARLSELNPAAHHVDISGATHSFPQTHPRAVADALKTFLAET